MSVLRSTFFIRCHRQLRWPILARTNAGCNQKAATRTAFDLVSSYTNLTFIEVSSGLASDAAIRIAHYGKGGSEAYYPSTDGRTAGDTLLGQRHRILGDDLRELFRLAARAAPHVGDDRLVAAELHDVRHRRAAGPLRR